MTFMNATKETYSLYGAGESKTLCEQDSARVTMYPPPPLVMSPVDLVVYLITLLSARELLWDFEWFFNLSVALSMSTLSQ